MTTPNPESVTPVAWYYEQRIVDRSAVGEIDRKRLLEHVISDVAYKILSEPGANPVGLTITVLLHGKDQYLEVVGTAPRYQPEALTAR